MVSSGTGSPDRRSCRRSWSKAKSPKETAIRHPGRDHEDLKPASGLPNATGRPSAKQGRTPGQATPERSRQCLSVEVCSTPVVSLPPSPSWPWRLLGAPSERIRRSAFDRPLAAFDAAAVERAKAGAARWLEKPECLKVLTDFSDGQGRTLDLALETWGMSATEYVLACLSGTGPRYRAAATRASSSSRTGATPDLRLPRGRRCPQLPLRADPGQNSRSRGGHGDPRDAAHTGIGGEPTQQLRDHGAGAGEVPLRALRYRRWAARIRECSPATGRRRCTSNLEETIE